MYELANSNAIGRYVVVSSVLGVLLILALVMVPILIVAKLLYGDSATS